MTKVRKFRVCSFIFLFTPSLGLFDTLHHGRLALLDAYVDGNSADDLQITFSKSWEPFKIKDISEFPGIPMIVVLTVMLSLCIFHILASACILKVLFRKKLSGGLLLQSLHSFVAPPLQFDWELLYRDETQKLSVIQSWRRCVQFYSSSILECCNQFAFRSKIAFLANVLLTAFEHLICCIPLVILKISIQQA